MTREAMLAVVAKVATAVQGPVGISQIEYKELRHALERVAADPALPIDVGEVIDTALIWLWTLANRPHAAADGRSDELRSRLNHDLLRMQRLIQAQKPETA